MNAWSQSRPRVFAASAAIRLLFGEPGAERIESRLGGACISALSYHDVLTKLRELGVDTTLAEKLIDELDLEIVPFGREQAVLASMLRPLTRAAGLTFGDCTCLALSRMRNAIALTADSAWRELKLGIGIEIIR